MHSETKTQDSPTVKVSACPSDRKRGRKKVKVKLDQRFKMFIPITACHQLLSVRQQTATQIQGWLPLTKPPYLTCPPVLLTRPSSPPTAVITSLVLLPQRQRCCNSNIKSAIKKVYLLYLRQGRSEADCLLVRPRNDWDAGEISSSGQKYSGRTTWIQIVSSRRYKV